MDTGWALIEEGNQVLEVSVFLGVDQVDESLDAIVLGVFVFN